MPGWLFDALAGRAAICLQHKLRHEYNLLTG